MKDKIKKKLMGGAEETLDKVVKIGKKTAKGAQKGAGIAARGAQQGAGVAAKGAQVGVQKLVDMVNEERTKGLKKKYTPVFMADFQAPGYNLPNMIVIVDDVSTINNEIFDGSIGWRKFVKGIEVFHLHDEEVANSGLRFFPPATCDAIYYVDPTDRNRFIQIDSFFDKTQESKLAELQHIAYSLGAKKYRVQMIDTKETSVKQQRKAGTQGGKGPVSANAQAEDSYSSDSKKKLDTMASATFAGERLPTRPSLRWFAHDDNILNLINMRCVDQGQSTVTSYRMEIKGTDYSSMSQTTASKVDAAAGKLGKTSTHVNMSKRLTEERNRILVYEIEF